MSKKRKLSELGPGETALNASAPTKVDRNATSNAKLIRLKEALSDVLSFDDSLGELVGHFGQEIADQCRGLQSTLRTKILNSPEETHSGNSNGSGAFKSGVRVPASLCNIAHFSLQFPPLPQISDAALESKVFTHPASLDAFHSGSRNAANLSYERLEFIGDAYLECIASRILYTHFPYFSPGKLSSIRESLVRNETLASFALGYGFSSRIQIPKVVRASMLPKSWTKTLADVFEAYIAAVIFSSPENGFDEVESWLSRLWADILMENSETEINPQAKQQLSKKLMGKGIKLEYRDERKPEELKSEGKSRFFIGVYLTGWGWENEHLGSGVAYSKAEAGTRAAMEALINLPLVDQIAAIKQAYDKETKTKREAENGRGLTA